jgi:hypothetical protein
LVGGREGFLQTGVPIAELVTPSLFRFNALLANGLAANVIGHGGVGRDRRLELLVVIFLSVHGGSLGVGLIGSLAVPPTSAKSWAVGNNTNGVEAMRPGRRGIRTSRTGAAVA